MSDDLISNLREMLGSDGELSSSSSDSEEPGSGEDDGLFSQLSSMMTDEPAAEADGAGSGSSDEEAAVSQTAEEPLLEVSVRLVDRSLKTASLDAAESSDEEPNALEALATEQAEAERLATEQAAAEAIATAERKRAEVAEEQARAAAAAAEVAKQEEEEERQVAENAERQAAENAEQASSDKVSTPDAGSSEEESSGPGTLATDQPELDDSDVGEFSDGGTGRPDYTIGQFLEELGTNPLVEELFLDADIDTLGQLAELIHKRSDLDKFLTKPEWIDKAWAEVKRINLPTPPANDANDTATHAGRTANPAAVEESSDEGALEPQDQTDPKRVAKEQEGLATEQKEEVIAPAKRPEATEQNFDGEAAPAVAAKEANQLAAENANQAAAVEIAPLDAAESSDEELNPLEALASEPAEAERLATEQATAEAIATEKQAEVAEEQARAAAAAAVATKQEEEEEERQVAENAEQAAHAKTALAEAETTAAAVEAVASEIAANQAAEQKDNAAAAVAAAKQAEQERLVAENVKHGALAETALAGAEMIAAAKQAVATEIARLHSVELEVQRRREIELEVERRWKAEHGAELQSQAEHSQPGTEPEPEPELKLVPDEPAEMPKWGTPSKTRSRTPSSRSRNDQTSRTPTRRRTQVQALSPKQSKESADKLHAAHERLLQKREHARETHFQEVEKQMKAKSPSPASTTVEQRKFTERVNKNAAGFYNFKDSVKLQQQLKAEVQKKREQRAHGPQEDTREERESKDCTFKPQLSDATLRKWHQKQREQVESKPDKELLGAWRVILPTKLHPNSEPASDLDFRPANDVEYKVAQVGDILRVTRVTRTPKGLRLHTDTHWVHSFTAKHGFRMEKKSTSRSLPGCVTHKTTSMKLREAEGAKRREIASDVRKMLDRAAERGELLSSDFGEQERTRRERNWHLRELRADVVKLDSAQRGKQLEHAIRIRHEQHELAAGTTPRQRRAFSPPDLSFNTVDVNFPIGGPHIPPELQRAPTSTRSTSRRARTPSRALYDTLPADRSFPVKTPTPSPIVTTQLNAVVDAPERLLTVLSTATAAQEAPAAETATQDDVELEIQRRWEAAHGVEPQPEPEPEPEPGPVPQLSFEATDQDVAARRRMQMLLDGLKQLNSLSDQMMQKLDVDGQDETVSANTYAEIVMAAAEDWLCGGGPMDATHQEHRIDTSLSASVDSVPLVLSASTAVAQLELEKLRREIRELGEGAVADVLDHQAIEQAIENKRQRRRRPPPAGRTDSGAAGSWDKGSRSQPTAQRVQSRVDARVRREMPTGQRLPPRQQQQRSPAGPTWQELRAETLRQDAELSAFIAVAKQASQHEKRMVEEWTQPASGVDSVMHQLHGQLQLMRSLVHDAM